MLIDVDGAWTGDDRRLIRWFADTSAVVAGVGLIAVWILHVVQRHTQAFFALEALLGLTAFTWRWLSVTADQRSASSNLVLMAATNWVVSLAAVLIEPWLIHFTPLVSLGPVLFAMGILDRQRYRAMAAVAVVIVMATVLVSRAPRHGPIMEGTPGWVRDLVTISLVPLLFVLLSQVCWYSHATIRRRVEQIEESQRRLLDAQESGQRSIERESIDLRRRLMALRQRIETLWGGEPADHRIVASDLMPDVLQASAELRNLSHGIMPPELRSGASDGPALAVIGLMVPFPVEVEVSPEAQDLPEVLESTVQSCAAEFLRVGTAASAVRCRIVLDRGDDMVSLRMEHLLDGRAVEDAMLQSAVADRVGALDGTVAVEQLGHRFAMVVRLPTSSPPDGAAAIDLLRATVGRRLISALAPAAVFPVAALAVVVILWLTVLRHDDMRTVVLLVAVVFALPSLSAIAVADRAPRLAIALLAGAYWVAALVVSVQLNHIKFFVALGLLIPVVASIPHLDRFWFGALVGVSAAVATIASAFTRLVDQLEVAEESPQWVEHATLVVLVPLASGVVLALSLRSHASLAVRSAELRASRRSVVEATDRVRRQIERDLHDGAQQRLVSASVRLQILARLHDDDRTAIDRNAGMVSEDFAAAEVALRVLERPGDQIDGAKALVDRLRRLCATTPIVVDLRADRLSDALDPEVATAVWFCCSEAIGNVVKHVGHGATATVSVGEDGGTMRFVISDDGPGFERGTHRGAGLRNLADRVTGLEGTLDIRSAAGRGTTVEGAIPLR